MNAGKVFRLFSLSLFAAACSPPPELPPEVPRRMQPIAAATPVADVPPPARCVRAWPETRYRNYGYDHIVHLSSRCHRTASCSVSTNVNPTPIVVAIGSGEHLEVLTFRGSPLPEFVMNVQCSRGTR